MEAEYVACGCCAACRSGGHITLRMHGDGHHAGNEPLGRGRAPISRKEGPHDDALIQFTRHGDNPGIAKPEGWPEPFRRRACCGDYRKVAATEFNRDAIRLEPEKVGMGVSMISDDVAPRRGLLEEFRTFTRVLSDNEKCRPGFVAIEQFQQLRSYRRIRAVVERESKLAR